MELIKVLQTVTVMLIFTKSEVFFSFSSRSETNGGTDSLIMQH
jgi:hypothetical protein